VYERVTVCFFVECFVHTKENPENPIAAQGQTVAEGGAAEKNVEKRKLK
jgi:hypothetical protein